MRKVILLMHVSLDGFVAGPNGEMDWISFDDELVDYVADQQFMKAGFIEEIQIHLVPVLLGDGIRLFEHIGTEQIELESAGVIAASDVTHLRFRVIRLHYARN